MSFPLPLTSFFHYVFFLFFVFSQHRRLLALTTGFDCHSSFFLPHKTFKLWGFLSLLVYILFPLNWRLFYLELHWGTGGGGRCHSLRYNRNHINVKDGWKKCLSLSICISLSHMHTHTYPTIYYIYMYIHVETIPGKTMATKKLHLPFRRIFRLILGCFWQFYVVFFPALPRV